MVVFDASVLIDIFDPKTKGPRKLRLDLLIKTLDQQGQKIVIPAPAYTEFLVGAASARSDYQSRIENSRVFRVEPYSKKVAMECAILLAAVFTSAQKRAITKTKLKFDWMIAATAKALGAACVYSCDDDIVRCSRHAGVTSTLVDDLPLPPVLPQFTLGFEAESDKG